MSNLGLERREGCRRIYGRPTHSRRALVAVALAATPAAAVTITVDTDLDVDLANGLCSLREAIVAANGDAVYNDCPAGSGPDRIVFAVPLPATILLNDHLPTITESLAIRGPGTGTLRLDGDNLYRPLHSSRTATAGSASATSL
jgi:CSLREA domain-containing protein